jgi:hypothetical protein
MTSSDFDDRHADMLKRIGESANYEAFADLYVRMLRGSIDSRQSFHVEIMDTLQDYYIGLLELSVESGMAVVDTSIGGDFKKSRRKMYFDSQAEVARLEAKISQVLQAVALRKAQG